MAKRPAVKRPASRRVDEICETPESGRTRAAQAAAPKKPQAGPASAQVSAAPQPGVETGTAMRPTHSPGAYRAKVRMYRQGLGDCFLISLKRRKAATTTS